MELVISSGHGSRVRGASGFIDEVNESRRVVDRVAELLRSAGVGVKIFHDNSSTSVSQNLSTITNYHNAQRRDRDASVHFNAFATTQNPRGTECLYSSRQALAAEVSSAMARGGGFVNRGAKKRTDLAFLNRVKNSVLLEVCFVDSAADVALYRKNFESICRGIAESLSGVRIPGEQPPVEPPAPPPTGPELPTGEHVVDVTFKIKGNPLVVINDDPINEATGAPDGRLALNLATQGDILVTINGEDFQVPLGPPPPAPSRSTLRMGSRGNDVKIVQEALKAQPVDGVFGPVTDRAVKNFQQAQQLTVDGVVGPITWAALERLYPWAFVGGVVIPQGADTMDDADEGSA